METINLGKVAFSYKGDYNPATTYASKDVVFDGESSYISKSDGNVGNALSDATFWGYLAKGSVYLSEQNAEDIDTLRADLNILDNEVSVKNAEQDNSIKSIEQILSQSNINQTAQVSSTGREIVSLPKTASNGGMEIKLEGLTATNLVSGKAVAAGASVTFQTILNNKYYISTALAIAIGDGNIYTATNNTASSIDIISVNLTSTFGSGNEPDFATCDAMFSSYFEGTKSFIPTGRVRSVGKNIWNTTLESGSIGADGALYVNAAFTRPKDYISVIPNTGYKISRSDLQPYSAYINYYDINRKSISQSVSSINQFTTPSNCYFIKFSMTNTKTLVNLQIEKGLVATTYEPYKETELYLTTPELRSNGIVKDEIRKGANGYELVKRVGVGVLGSNVVLNGGFDTTDNWVVPENRANIANGALNIDVTTWAKDIRQNCNLNVGYYLAEFDIISVARGGSLTMHSDNAVYNSIGVAGRYRHIFYCKTAGLRALYINSANIACSVDNISIRQIISADVPNVINPVISTSALPIVAGSDIRFAIEIPIITPIDHVGVLNSAESGTVYYEPVVADAGVYGANLTVLNAAYPIASLEEIIVHTAVDTYLDVSKAVIAANGLSFTHPDLRAGDLVLFTYFFSKEKVNGLITATYYDGRYVIADTSNGKFYKWGVKSTNGVATIQLTEV